MTRPFQLVAAGIAMVGTAFGLARYGYGLLLPEIRSDFGLSSAALGLIATGSYVGYLLTTAAMAAVGDRAPPRRPVGLGGVAAGAGMGLIAAAHSPGVLASGGGGGSCGGAARGGGGRGGRGRGSRPPAVLDSRRRIVAAGAPRPRTRDDQLGNRVGRGHRGSHRAGGGNGLARSMGRVRRDRGAL